MLLTMDEGLDVLLFDLELILSLLFSPPLLSRLKLFSSYAPEH